MTRVLSNAKNWPVACALLLAFSSAVYAEIKLPAIIGDGMVIQRDKPIRLWGWTDQPAVAIRLGEKEKVVKPDENGRWSVVLKAMPAGGPHEIVLSTREDAEVRIRDVLVGEVWVCSGQSNMEWSAIPQLGIDNNEAEVAAANYPQIRLIDVPNVAAETPQDDFKGKWQACTPESMRPFSAVGYYFGRKLHKELGVPVGLIGSNWGGTEAEPWTSPQAMAAEPKLKAHLEQWEKNVAANEKLKLNPQRPSVLYNAMIAPIVSYPIRGAIWYQGESNVTRAYDYRVVFPTLIKSWRTAWGDRDMPFYFVQIAPFKYTTSIPQWKTTEQHCAELWDSQLYAYRHVKSTGMVVVHDIGNVNDIHPRNKLDVGRRLANWALANTYGKDGIVYSGPIYKSFKKQGDKIVLRFDDTGSGLESRDGKSLTHFTLAAEDQQFKPAVAEIVGDTVVVRSDEVAKPVAVRFAWHEAAEPNLMNKEGLPASPFRTDDWKLITQQ